MGGFNERLKELRSRCGLTQQELAQMLNISTAAVSHYERGFRQPDIAALEALHDIFNVSYDYLLGEGGETMEEIIKVKLEFEITKEEFDLIQKYRGLDEKGRQLVRVVLDAETELAGKEK